MSKVAAFQNGIGAVRGAVGAPPVGEDEILSALAVLGEDPGAERVMQIQAHLPDELGAGDRTVVVLDAVIQAREAVAVAQAKVHSDEVLEQYIKVSADTIGALRKGDVFRVLDAVRADNMDGVTRSDLASFIAGKRPELVAEVTEVMAEEFPGEAWGSAEGKLQDARDAREAGARGQAGETGATANADRKAEHAHARDGGDPLHPTARRGELAVGTEVGGHRWPYESGHPDIWGTPWKGVVLALNDPRAWAGNPALDTQEKVDMHLAWSNAHGLLKESVPVLWAFGRDSVVYFQSAKGDAHCHDLVPYAEDCRAWEAARAAAYKALEAAHTARQAETATPGPDM